MVSSQRNATILGSSQNTTVLESLINVIFYLSKSMQQYIFNVRSTMNTVNASYITLVILLYYIIWHPRCL